MVVNIVASPCKAGTAVLLAPAGTSKYARLVGARGGGLGLQHQLCKGRQVHLIGEACLAAECGSSTLSCGGAQKTAV